MDGDSRKIIGVAPPELEALDARIRFLLPLAWKASWIDPTQRYFLDKALFARLKRNVTIGQAQAEAAAIEHRFYDSAPDWNKKVLDRSSYRILVETVQTERIQQETNPLYLLEGGVLLVLLIGCVNVANLLLARANSRQGELAIRLALGATRGAIARQLLVESMILTVTGSALGVGGALGSIRAINGYWAKAVPGTLPLAIDGRVLGFTVALTLAVGLLIGLLPLWHVLRPQSGRIRNLASPTVASGRSARTLGGILVTGQVAVTLVLLAGAGLLIRSFANAVSVNPGLDPSNLITARIALGRPYWNDRGAVFQTQLIHALGEIPGVSAAAIGSNVPFEGNVDHRVLTLKDSPISAGSMQPNAFEVGVSAGYFETLHIRLLEGRVLTIGILMVATMWWMRVLRRPTSLGDRRSALISLFKIAACQPRPTTGR